MSLPSKQTFFYVKEKLDYYRISSSFPAQATNVIHKLIMKLEQYQGMKTDRTKDSLSGGLTPRGMDSGLRDETVLALESKVKKLLKQNNILHCQILQMKQHTDMLKQCKQWKSKMDAIMSNNNISTNNNRQSNQLTILRNGFQVLKARQVQLFQQLTQVKYKYNELMDLVYEDPLIEKKYLKRLLKHRKLELSNEQQSTNQLFQKNFRSQTHYTTQQKPDKLDAIQFQKLQAQKLRLQVTIKSLKIKLENREVQILRLHNKMIEQFNLDGVRSQRMLEKKDGRIMLLEDQVEMLMGKIGELEKSGRRQSVEQGKGLETREKSLGRTGAKSPQVTIAKSPQGMNSIKSPPKRPQKPTPLNKPPTVTPKPARSPSLTKPQHPTSLSQLQTQNLQLKLDIQQLKKQNQQLKHQLQRHNQKLENGENGKSSEELEKELGEVKGQLQEKEAQLKKVEARWRDVQEENRILIQELSEKRKYLQDLLKHNQGLEEYHKVGKVAFVEENIVNEEKPSQSNKDLAKNKPPFSKNNNKPQSNRPGTDNSKQKGPLSPRPGINPTKPDSNPSNSKSPNIKKPDIKTTAGMRTTNIQTTTNLLSTNLQTNLQTNQKPSSNFSKSTPYYTPSQYQTKSQKPPSRIYSQKIDIDLNSEQSQHKQYPSNIHSRISSGKSEKMHLHQIQEESLEKSHHSQEEKKQKPREMKGIRISIKNNNEEQVEQRTYQNRLYSQHSGANHKSESQQNNIQPENPQNYSTNQLPNEQNDNNPNFLGVDDDDKASVFSMRKEIDQLKLDNRKELKSRKKLQKSLKDTQEEKQKLQDKILMLQAKITQLQQSSNLNYTSPKSDISGDTAQLDRKLRKKIKQQQQRIQQLEEDNTQTMLQIRDKDAKIKQLEVKLSSVEKKIEDLRSGIKKLEDQNLQLKKEREKLLVLRQDDNSHNRDSFKKADVIRNEARSSTVIDSTQIMWLKKEIKTLQAKIQKYTQTINQLNDYISMHRQQKQKLSIEKLNLQKENDYLKKKLQELQRALTIQAQEMKRYRETFEM